MEFTVVSLSRHFCSYNNSLNIDLYTFFRNLKHVVSKYTDRRVHKNLKIVHDWRSQSLFFIPRIVNQLNKPDNNRAPLVWENVLVLAFPPSVPLAHCLVSLIILMVKAGVGLLILVRTKWIGAVTCWASWAVWRGFASTILLSITKCKRDGHNRKFCTHRQFVASLHLMM